MVTRLVLRRWTTDAAMGHAGAAVPGGGVAGIQEPPWESVALTDKGLRALSSLTALTSLSLYSCRSVTAAGKQALRTAIPNLTIRD